ncbi:MAG: hypothetical protein ABI574_18005 [Burkholderiales bacterium]
MRIPRRFLTLFVPAIGMLAALCGCATRVEVRSLGSADPSQAFYEMRGHTLATLHQRAAQLCPAGYAVLRQAQNGHAADPAAGLPSKAVMAAADTLFPAGADSAQLLVQCEAPAASQPGPSKALSGTASMPSASG